MEQAGRRSWRCCRSHQPLILLSHLTPIPKLLHLQGNCRVEQVELQGNPVPGPTTREIGGRGEAPPGRRLADTLERRSLQTKLSAVRA